MEQQAGTQAEAEPLQSDSELGRLCADVMNAVQDYCDDGIDAFQSCLVHAPGLEPATLEIIRKGSNRLHESLSAHVLASLSLFEQLCTTIVFSAPDAMMQEALLSSDNNGTSSSGATAPMSDASAPSLEHQQLEGQLEAIRMQLKQADMDCMDLKARAAKLDTQLSLYGNLGPLQAVAATVHSACDSGALDDLRAIAHARQLLAPLLHSTSRLLQRVGDQRSKQDSALSQKQQSSLRMPWAGEPLLGSLDNLQPVRAQLEAA